VSVTAETAFDLYHETVFRFAWRMTRRSDRAEDITQECFLSLVRAPGRFDASRGSMKTYLISIARNLALKDYRDHRAEIPLDNEDYVSTQPGGELSSAVEQAVAGLPALQQEVVVLFEFEGFTLEEIAQISGADVGTIKSRLHRARERLKRVLAPYKTIGDGHGTV
jgi:RNA polymerase sigma-70 factor (ECF subfamily)